MSAKKALASLRAYLTETLRELTLPRALISFFSSGVLAFGLYNIHAQSDVTEGGILGLTLLLEYWFSLSPAISGAVLNALCYLIGWRLLGKGFLAYSMISAGGFSLFYGIFEQFPPVFPEIAQMPLAASVIGALFVGITTGLCVRIGGAPGGDDALAMSMCKVTPLKIQWAYMLTDLVVLGLSLTYIPLSKILYSLLTVTLSGQLVGVVQNLKLPALKRSSMADEAG